MPQFTTSPKLGQSLHVEYAYEPVTPSDSADVPTKPNQQCVGVVALTAGNIAVNLATGGTAVLTGLSAGQVVDVWITRVRATSTTATVAAIYRGGCENVGK